MSKVNYFIIIISIRKLHNSLLCDLVTCPTLVGILWWCPGDQGKKMCKKWSHGQHGHYTPPHPPLAHTATTSGKKCWRWQPIGHTRANSIDDSLDLVKWSNQVYIY